MGLLYLYVLPQFSSVPLLCKVLEFYVVCFTKKQTICAVALSEILLYKTLIRPIVASGAETRTMTKKEEQAPLIFERKIFRRIYGPKYEDGEWKSRMNKELEEMSKGEHVVIKGQRIGWLGHL